MNTPETTKITIEHLIKMDLLHADAAKKHRGKIDRFNQILGGRGKRAVESQVTTFMTMFGGRLEQIAIKFLCTAAGADYPEDLQIISGGEFRADSVKVTLRTIDLVIVGRNDDHLPAPRGLHWKPVVAVEAKYGAWVNAGNGFCGFTTEEDRHEDGYLPYSNQAICYPHGCIDDRLHTDKGVRFVWLGEGRPDPDGVGPWARKGLHPGDARRIPGFDVAFPLQEAAIAAWTPVTWNDLGDAITKEIGGPEAAAIVRFLRAGGPASN